MPLSRRWSTPVLEDIAHMTSPGQKATIDISLPPVWSQSVAGTRIYA